MEKKLPRITQIYTNVLLYMTFLKCLPIINRNYLGYRVLGMGFWAIPIYIMLDIVAYSIRNSYSFGLSLQG